MRYATLFGMGFSMALQTGPTSPPASPAGAFPAPGSPLRRLLDGPVRSGRVVWIGVRPARHAAVATLDQADVDPASGVIGDHYAGRSGSRQVSLIAEEALAAIGAFLGSGPADPSLLRRNIVVAGLNLLALKGRRFQLGSAVLEYAGECHPCSRMETLLGPGGYNAVRGQGGILARVLVPGTVGHGDALTRLEDAAPEGILAK